MNENEKADLRREILDPLMVAMSNHHEETRSLVERCIADQVEIRAELATMRARLDALEASRSAQEGRLSSHEHKISAADEETARRIRHATTEIRNELTSALEGVGRQYNALATNVNEIGETVLDMKADLEKAVLRALDKHVKTIEDAANKLTQTPQVRTAASIGGAFAGSALVAVIIEVIKQL